MRKIIRWSVVENPPTRSTSCRGMINVYMFGVATVLFAVAALTVDAGRLMVAKAQLQTTADSAARYAAAGMVNSSTKSLTAYNQALVACNDQRVDGRAPSVTSANVVLGIWDANANTFTPSADNVANGVRVTVTQTLGGTGSPTLFSRALGSGTKTITATSISTASVISTTVVAPSKGNLWLAGAADNTTVTNLQGNSSRYDNSGTSSNTKQRPQEVLLSTLGLSPGDTVSFEGLSG
ncbi:MAG TPA: pilus assembly protein TadG-related protein, partial [Tepidisphaeraceae bacterium]|nr:pilus assembly protein TadG-related protein [Tepidisphaeraceae bacterium]